MKNEDAALRLHAADNVVIAKSEIPAGWDLPENGAVLRVKDTIPFGHKIATEIIGNGKSVRKYGQIIGFATRDIAPGDHVHSHNLTFGEFSRDYEFGAEASPADFVPEAERASLQGIVRADGRVATRNYLAILTSVNCSATVAAKGFVFMDTPGYDPVSVTGMVAGGTNVVRFTTGRGSVFGCKPTSNLKLATNSDMFNRMHEDMDINCGRIADGEADVASLGQEIFDLILATASGAPSRSEALGFGDAEFVPWQVGAVL
jgi:altronate dehydratase